MEQLRLVRVFGNGVTPSTEKAYRVESAHLTSEHDALSLRNDLNSREDSVDFRLSRSFSNGTVVSSENFRVETTDVVSERDALSIMRALNSPFEGSRYLFNRASVSNEDQQQQG